jgi:hypothetical protein
VHVVGTGTSTWAMTSARVTRTLIGQWTSPSRSA